MEKVAYAILESFVYSSYKIEMVREDVRKIKEISWLSKCPKQVTWANTPILYPTIGS